MKMQHCAPIIFISFIGYLLFFVRIAEQHEKLPSKTSARLYDVWNIAFISAVLVDILQIFSRILLMATQIVISAIMHSFEFFEAHWELIFDIIGIFGVVS